MNKGRFKKGQVPWNKDMKGYRPSKETEFSTGAHHTGEQHPSWKGGVQKNVVDCTYLHVGNGKRVRRPRKIYEDNFGAIPKGFVIIHKDGIKDNDEPDNLEAISRAELVKRNRAK